MIPSSRSRKLLLVEDDRIIALGEKQTLEQAGYSVATTHTGAEAVSAVATDPEIGLVLMDIDLGEGIDGTEAARQILALRPLPIVFLTGHAEREYVDRVHSITRYGYVLKNTGDLVLLQSISMALDLFETQALLRAENEERQEAEERRDEYRRLLVNTINAVDSLLVVIDPELRIVLSNWHDHEWVPESERGTRPYCYQVMKNFSAPCPGCPPQQTFTDGQPRFYEDRNPIDGSYKEISVVPIPGSDGSVQYVLENVRGVSARRPRPDAADATTTS